MVRGIVGVHRKFAMRKRVNVKGHVRIGRNGQFYYVKGHTAGRYMRELQEQPVLNADYSHLRDVLEYTPATEWKPTRGQKRTPFLKRLFRQDSYNTFSKVIGSP
jgi:hypothetical protein